MPHRSRHWAAAPDRQHEGEIEAMSLNTLGEWSDFLQAVGALATALLAAIGLVMVVVELRSLTKSINGNSSAQVYTYMMDLVRIQIEHPELRAYVYGGRCPPEGGIEAQRLAAFFGAFGDFMEFVFAQRRLGILPESEFRDPWQPFFAKLLSGSPGLKAYISNADYYCVELRRFAQSTTELTAEKP